MAYHPTKKLNLSYPGPRPRRLGIGLRALIIAILAMMWLSASSTVGINKLHAQAGDLFLSEYVDGSATNKALEIFNGTGASIDLSLYRLELYNNGNSGAPNAILPLSGTLENGKVYVVAHPQAVVNILSVSNITSLVTSFNGNDVILLKRQNTVIDRFGRFGEDPGSEWSGGGIGTRSVTLRRKPNVCGGDPNYTAAFNPSLQWDQYPRDDFNGLGNHISECAPSPSVNPKINEFVLNHIGANTHEFIEIYGAANTNYGFYSLVVLDGDITSNPGRITHRFLIGTTNPGGDRIAGPAAYDFRNGTSTILLVRDLYGQVGDDLDTNNDGILNITPWSEIVDNVAVRTSRTGDLTYSLVVLNQNFDNRNVMVGGASRIPNGVDNDSVGDWMRNHFDGQNLGCGVCGGSASVYEAVNTPNSANYPGSYVPPTETLTPTGVPPTALPPQPTATATPIGSGPEGDCVDIVVDGGFETNSGWIFGRDPVPPQYTGAEKRSGLRSVLLGNPPGSSGMNQVSYSSVRQLVTVPPHASTATLRWYHNYRTDEAANDAPGRWGDRQETILLAPNQMTIEILSRVRRNTAAWQEEQLDITRYIGKSFYLYFNVFNDGNGQRTWMYLDDVALLVCYPPATATPPPTLTPIASATETVTPPPTATETATPTETPTPTSTVAPASVPPASVPGGGAGSEGVAESGGQQPAPPLAIPEGCTELVVNGDFEQLGQGWNIALDEHAATYGSTVAFGGSSQSMCIGIVEETNAISTSEIEQSIDLPEGYASIVLSFRYFPLYSAEPGEGDLQYVDIYNAFTDQFSRRILSVQRNDRAWLLNQYDLTSLAGQPIRLQFAVENDGADGHSAMYVDRVSILACDPAAVATSAAARESGGLVLTVTPVTATPAEGGVSSTTGDGTRPLWMDRIGTVAVLLGILILIGMILFGLWVLLSR